jgi:hypothetical protein
MLGIGGLVGAVVPQEFKKKAANTPIGSSKIIRGR